MAYQLMLRFPERYAHIRGIQAGRITNPDRKETFDFVSRACNGSSAECEEFFRYLLTTEGRSVESRTTRALSMLGSPLRDNQPDGYIIPGLEIIETVQREGDIFFPQQWCGALLNGHDENVADSLISCYLDTRTDLNPLLATKILQFSSPR